MTPAIKTAKMKMQRLELLPLEQKKMSLSIIELFCADLQRYTHSRATPQRYVLLCSKDEYFKLPEKVREYLEGQGIKQAINEKIISNGIEYRVVDRISYNRDGTGISGDPFQVPKSPPRALTPADPRVDSSQPPALPSEYPPGILNFEKLKLPSLPRQQVSIPKDKKEQTKPPTKQLFPSLHPSASQVFFRPQPPDKNETDRAPLVLPSLNKSNAL